MRGIAVCISESMQMSIDPYLPAFNTLTEAILWRQPELLYGVTYRIGIAVLGAMLDLKFHGLS